ncbi:MAG: VOC family protein [Alicyclobacillaceae bacterium]|nr:VOC family protein [Alicyclobacillaceae bacterium]
MMGVSLGGITIQVTDLEVSREFYKTIPGAVEEVFIPGRISILRMGQARLGLLQTGSHRGFHLELESANLDVLFETLKTSGIPITGAPKTRPHGERTFVVADPDGYSLEFEEVDGLPSES